MRRLVVGRSGIVQTAVVSLLTLVALVLLGAVLAYWTWAWLTPRPEPRAPAYSDPEVSAKSASDLFGAVQRDANAAAPTGIAIKLLGIAAASGGRRGYAVVQLEGSQIRAVSEGEDIAPGIRLAEVDADAIILDRNGIRETLTWPEKGRAEVRPAPRT